VTNRVLRLILVSPERHCCEDGILPFTPWPVINSGSNEFAGARVRLIVPQDFPAGYEIPVVAWVVNDQDHAVRANGLLNSEGQTSIQVKRGVGSGFLAATNPAGALEYRTQIGVLQTNKTINLESAPTWTSVSGTLSGAVNWPAGSRIAVTGNLTIPSGSTWTIGAGTIVRLNAGINIYLNGSLVINGTVEQPVVFMPNSRSQPWGGFFLQASTSQITATGAVFVASGANPTGGAGHRQEQCLFYCDTRATISLTDSAAIALAGQLGHTTDKAGVASYFITYNRFLSQGATTGGEYYDTVFTANDSAFIDFYVPAPFGVFHDGDEDGLYFKNIPTGYRNGLTNTLIGWTKDDGVDSGGSGAGLLIFQSCWFESIYHEANSLSGNGKDVYHFDDVILGCGQAFEAGYEAPTGTVNRCLILSGNTGVRFGDNYHPSQNSYGFMRATNSIIINNHLDAWGLNWLTWSYRTDRMDVQNNFLTTPNPNHPNNAVWNPSADAWRLEAFMTTPPEAAVGMGFAVWTNQFTLASLFKGVPVGLSTFTTNVVTVDYTFENADGPLAGGTLTFVPGETIRRIYPSGFNLAGQSLVRVVLGNSTHAELTGQTNVTFAGSVATPQVALNVVTNRDSAWRVAEGVFASLNTPSALPVSLDYHFTTTNGTVENGTLIFAPLETRKQIFLSSASPFEFSQLQLAVDNPTNATLTGSTTISYSYVVVPLTLSLAATNQPSLDTFASGVTVLLNAPAASGLQVDYRVEGNRAGVTNGTLTFVSGALSALLQTPTISAADNDFIKVTLSNPQKASLAGPDTVCYVRPLVTTPVSPVTLVYRGSRSQWRYSDNGVFPGTTWPATNFVDSSWAVGGAPLGYGGGGETTTNYAAVKYFAYYYRHYFKVTNATSLVSLDFNLRRDDGAVVYLNGVKLYSENMPATVGNTTPALTNISGTPTTFRTTTFAASALPTPLLEGTNVIAVEIHQQNTGSSDIVFDLEVIGTPRPPVPPSAPLYLGRFGSELTLAWGDATFQLLTATNIAGPWTTNDLAIGTFSAPPTNTQTYYQLRRP
jgi:hypothetical protein